MRRGFDVEPDGRGVVKQGTVNRPELIRDHPRLLPEGRALPGMAHIPIRPDDQPRRPRVGDVRGEDRVGVRAVAGADDREPVPGLRRLRQGQTILPLAYVDAGEKTGADAAHAYRTTMPSESA